MTKTQVHLLAALNASSDSAIINNLNVAVRSASNASRWMRSGQRTLIVSTIWCAIDSYRCRDIKLMAKQINEAIDTIVCIRAGMAS